jgi:predicted GIY-YIG superfamily endonuclease
MQHLYRHFAKDGTLLYVGISKSAIQRLFEHKDDSFWFNDIAKMTIENFHSREEVKLAEKEAIKNENPLYNIRNKKVVVKDSEDDAPYGTVIAKLLYLPSREMLRNCMMAWTPPNTKTYKGGVYKNAGHVRIGPHPDTLGWSDPYLLTDGACWDGWRKLTNQERTNLLPKIATSMISDGIDQRTIHQAFGYLAEYNQSKVFPS